MFVWRAIFTANLLFKNVELPDKTLKIQTPTEVDP